MSDELVSQAGELEITIIQGDPFDLELTCLDSDDNPIILTGCSGRAQMREIPGGRLQLTFDVVVSQASEGEGTGVVSVHADPEDTALVRREGVWNLQLTSEQNPIVPVISPSQARFRRQVTT